MSIQGFSLVETLLVLAVLAVIAAIGLGMWRDVEDQHRLASAGESLQHLLRAARTSAVTAQTPVEVRVDPDLSGYTMALKDEAPALSRRLPRGVEFLATPSRRLTFFSRGTVVPAGTFVLANRRGVLRVVVSPSGRVRQERLLEAPRSFEAPRNSISQPTKEDS